MTIINSYKSVIKTSLVTRYLQTIIFIWACVVTLRHKGSLQMLGKAKSYAVLTHGIPHKYSSL